MVIPPISPISMPSFTATSSAGGTSSFEGMLGQAVQHLSDAQKNANTLAVNLATGKDVNLVDTVLAMEQTSLSFKLAMQVRDKVIGAYQDVMRTQM